jgi:hypothetical protein
MMGDRASLRDDLISGATPVDAEALRRACPFPEFVSRMPRHRQARRRSHPRQHAGSSDVTHHPFGGIDELVACILEEREPPERI